MTQDQTEKTILRLAIQKGLLSQETILQLQAELDSKAPETEEIPAVDGPDAKDSLMGLLQDWDRFQIGPLLGEGGMGRVFKAMDPRLRRPVALKFIRGESRDMERRFLIEAQTQARIEDDHVCGIYEVGEVGNRPYISMQYIDGQTYLKMGAKMSLHEKVRTMKQVAEAIHAAHRNGLIHRDIKPSNIMVEKTDSGVFRPFVMDFGLAREIAAQGMTTTGELVGSPQYMSPEQARGEVHRLDRRSDVYSLGATFYELLTGHPPFRAKSTVALFVKLLKQDAISMRKMDPSVPKDLDTIVLKCLEKDQVRRYDSAMGLAEDLGRFLDGEPVTARRASLVYRASKKIKKHKLFSSILAIAFLAIVVSAGFGLHARFKAAAQARLAQLFGAEAQRMDNEMRLAHMVPRHDISTDMQRVDSRMAWIRKHLQEVGSVGQRPGHFALGRGFLAFGDYTQARHHFEASWRAGDPSPDVAFALGLTLGHIYRQERDGLRSIPDPDIRREREEALALLYKKPAEAYLKQGHGASFAPPDYVTGLLALIQGQYDDALQLARKSCGWAPWFYEAHLLEGDTLKTMAIEARDRGEDESAREFFLEADTVYRKALTFAPSDPRIYDGLANLWKEVLDMRAFGAGGDLETPLNNAVDACSQGLEVAPSRVFYLTTESDCFRIHAQYQMHHGEDPSLAIEKALQAAQQAADLEPQKPGGYHKLGNALQMRAMVDLSKRSKDIQGVDAAREKLEYAHQLDPSDPFILLDLGNAYSISARAAGPEGDPMPWLKKAEEVWLRAIQLSPTYVDLRNNLALSYLRRGAILVDQGQDPIPLFQQAIHQCQQALTIKPTHLFAMTNLGLAYLNMGNQEIVANQNPSESFEAAAKHAREAIELNPDFPPNYLYCAQATMNLAEFRAKQEHPISVDAIQRELESIETILKRIANWPDAQLIRAQLLVIQAEHIGDPNQQLVHKQKAVDAMKEVMARFPGIRSQAQPFLDRVSKTQSR